MKLWVRMTLMIYCGFASSPIVWATSPSAGNSVQVTLKLKSLDIPLHYSHEVRFLQVIEDAYAKTNYEVYELGSALIDPTKSAIVDKEKFSILEKLYAIGTTESIQLAKMIEDMNFAYREPIQTNRNKIRIRPEFNPMLHGDYWLILPERPDKITVIDPNSNHPHIIPLATNFSLKDYLSDLPNIASNSVQNAWIIQANQDVYEATGINWKNTPYFLSPGAIVFLGLQDLPDQFHDLNASIAHLLAWRVEL